MLETLPSSDVYRIAMLARAGADARPRLHLVRRNAARPGLIFILVQQHIMVMLRLNDGRDRPAALPQHGSLEHDAAAASVQPLDHAHALALVHEIVAQKPLLLPSARHLARVEWDLLLLASR